MRITSSFSRSVYCQHDDSMRFVNWLLPSSGPVFYVLAPGLLNWACSWAKTELTLSKYAEIIFYLLCSEFVHDLKAHWHMMVCVILQLVLKQVIDVWFCKRSIIVYMIYQSVHILDVLGSNRNRNWSQECLLWNIWVPVHCRNLVWHNKRNDTNASPMTTDTSRPFDDGNVTIKPTH